MPLWIGWFRSKSAVLRLLLPQLHVFWGDNTINIIDTPGHVDFTVEVERSLRILDGMVAVFCAVAGVQPQSETVWRQATKYKVPRIAFVNKMDRVGANYDRCVQMMIQHLHANPLMISYPIGKEDYFTGVIDLIGMKEFHFVDSTKGKEYLTKDISPENMELIKKFREKVVEKAAESDDKLLEKYLETGELAEEEIVEGIRKMTISGNIVPVLCGSAFKNKGVQPLLDAICAFLPSPLDVDSVAGTDAKSGEEVMVKPDPEEPFSALAFKVQTDPFVGKLTYIRLYSGRLVPGSYVYNSTKGERERIGRILRMHANTREEVKEAQAGDIVAAIGLKVTKTGDTLTDEKRQVILENIDFPEPVIFVAIEPKTKSDQEKLSTALEKLSDEIRLSISKWIRKRTRPLFRVWVNFILKLLPIGCFESSR